jgi:D-glycero-D-manno-heptose 1,7-bisphosphate phosphatase
VTWTVFLDRDGVINQKAAEDDYVTSWQQFRFLPGVLEALRSLHDAGARVVVITNQRGVARGRMSEADVTEIHLRMRAAVATAGGRIDAVYHCPHEAGTCDCRKPGTGLYRQARRDIPEIRFDASATVGDSLGDLEAARHAGSQVYLVVDGERGAHVLAEAVERGLPVAGTGSSLNDVVIRHLLPLLAHDGSAPQAAR